jgi:alanyl-tRNA synthetase
VKATGQIGYFKITSESAVAAGIRRIEAVTALKAEEFFDNQTLLLNEVKALLKNNKDVVKSLSNVLEENTELQKQVQGLMREKAQTIKRDLLSKIKSSNGINFICELVVFDNAEELKNMLFEIRNQTENCVCIIGAEVKGKPSISVIISDNLVKDKNLNAGTIIKDLAKEINGGGGGQPFYAQAGGSKLEGLKTAIDKAKGMF